MMHLSSISYRGPLPWVHCGVPELPEMHALAERLNALLAGTTLLRADVLGFSSLKTYAPTPDSVLHHRLISVGRRGKYLVWEFDDGVRIVLHLSQAGRLDVEQPPKQTRPRGSAVRFVFGAGLEDPSVGVLLREHGTHRKASWWVLAPEEEGPLAGLGPEPGSAEFAELIRTSNSKRRLTTDLRNQHVVSGIGRGWGDDILHRAKLSPFASLSSLSPEQRESLLSPLPACWPRHSNSSALAKADCPRPNSEADSKYTAAQKSHALQVVATHCAVCRLSPTR